MGSTTKDPGESARKIGRYLIQSEIGRGGMAMVCLAHDPRFKRSVAIKLMPRELVVLDPSFRARFEREAETIAALEHSAIVPVYDYGEEDGQPYLVMRYMPGGSLEGRMQRGVIPLAEASRLLNRLAPALDYAHAQGIIHRDLKPGNILFDQHDEPYIADFGIVKLKQATTTLTGGAIVGTPAYMSPEQGRGRSDIDGRADIYSLGAILYQMLSGKLPYEADTPTGQIIAHITEPVPNLLASRPDLPPGIQAVIESALAKQREDRYATVREMASALEAISTEHAGRSVAAPPAPERHIDEVEVPAEETLETPQRYSQAQTPPIPAAPVLEIDLSSHQVKDEIRLPSFPTPFPGGDSEIRKHGILLGVRGRGLLIILTSVLLLGLVVVLLGVAGIAITNYLAGQSATRTKVALVGLIGETSIPSVTRSGVMTSPSPYPSDTPTATMAVTLAFTPQLTQTSTLTQPPVLSRTPTSSGPYIYKVQESDTLFGIAQKFGVTLEIILAYNPNIDPKTLILYVGQEIIIPPPGTTLSTVTPIPPGWSGIIDYVVQTGDTLDSIALKFNSTVASIYELNKDILKDANSLFVGLTIKVKVNLVTPVPTPAISPTQTLGAGSTMVAETDGMTLVYVPEGEFWMGSSDSDPQALDNEKPLHKVYLDAYWIDRTEVTNHMYALCVAAGICQPPRDTSSYTRSSYYGKPEYSNYPVINVDWNYVKTYCEWAGRRLPTEAQWEKAARGTDARIYPWGNDIDCIYANYSGCRGDTAPVGSFLAGASPYGVLDMAGNVWEWVADWYGEGYYSNNPVTNPMGPDSGSDHLRRGGSFYAGTDRMRTSSRSRSAQAVILADLGFRCVRTP